MSFSELCMRPLGAGEYLKIAEIFKTLILSDIPLIDIYNNDAAKRFVTLIDALYEARVKLICSAAAEPDKLYPKGHGKFEFKRTTSRLIEMQSLHYMSLSHVLRS